MAVHNIILVPLSAIKGSSFLDEQKAIDNKLETYAYQFLSGTGAILVYNYDASSLQLLLNKGAAITAVRAKLYMSGGTSHSVRLVTDISSISDYTDCGDGSVSFTAAEGWNAISFNNGTIYCVNNINKLLNGDIGVRLYTKKQDTKLYEAQVEVECILPDITYTYVNYDGTVLKEETVEQGTDPTPPSDPTRPSTAQYKYTFSGWSLSGTTYTAQYTATTRRYTISTAVSPEGAGTVTGGGSGKYGTTKTLTATPNDGYQFVGWSDGDTTNPRTVTIKKKATYTAQFEEVQTSKIRYGADVVKTVFDTQKNKAKSVWYGSTQIL